MYILIDSKLQICDKSFKTTPQGYLQLDAIVARSGKQDYLAHELGIFDGDPNRVIVLDRPANEVTHSLAIASFMSMPVTDDHPAVGQVNSTNFSQLSKGIVLDVEPTPSDQIKASLLVMDEALIKKIKDGKRELSAGYSAEIEFSDDGNTAIQRKIRGNHIAFVDAARCGKECRIFDSMPKPIPKEENNMAKLKIKGAEYEVADALVPVIQGLIDDASTLSTALTDSQSEVSKQTALKDAAEEKAKEMEDEDDEDEKEKKLNDAVEARMGVLVSASKFLKDYDPKGKTILQIKTDVLTDALPDLDLKDKEPAYIDTRFEILCEDGKPSESKKTLNDGLRDQMGNESAVDVNDAVAVARANKIKRVQAIHNPQSKEA